MHNRETPDDTGELSMIQPMIPDNKKITTDQAIDCKSLFNLMNMNITTKISKIQINGFKNPYSVGRIRAKIGKKIIVTNIAPNPPRATNLMASLPLP